MKTKTEIYDSLIEDAKVRINFHKKRNANLKRRKDKDSFLIGYHENEILKEKILIQQLKLN